MRRRGKHLRRFFVFYVCRICNPLAAVSYDEKSYALKATFWDSGRTYVYEGVPQKLYDALLFADSVGAFFNRHIRDSFRFHET